MPLTSKDIDDLCQLTIDYFRDKMHELFVLKAEELKRWTEENRELVDSWNKALRKYSKTQ